MNMNWFDYAPYLVGGGGMGAAFVGIFLRKFFVNWSKENVVVQSADATATMMQNFHSEIKRLATQNEEFAKENALLRKQISKLEAILEKLAIKFDIDISELIEQDHE